MFEEKFSLQSWGAFCIAVAAIVHFARSFPKEAQRSIAWAMLLCFSLETGLYAFTISKLDEQQVDETYKHGVMATGSVFAGLFVAYAGALAYDS